jgi:hypothetical protein
MVQHLLRGTDLERPVSLHKVYGVEQADPPEVHNVLEIPAHQDGSIHVDQQSLHEHAPSEEYGIIRNSASMLRGVIRGVKRSGASEAGVSIAGNPLGPDSSSSPARMDAMGEFADIYEQACPVGSESRCGNVLDLGRSRPL